VSLTRYALQNLAAQLIGTPQELADEIGRLIATMPTTPPSSASEVEQRRAIRSQREQHEQISIIRHRLARDYGALRGWTWSESTFGPAVLSRRGVHGARDHSGQWPGGGIADHNYFYRANRRAAALVTHPYDVDQAKMEAWATEHRLKVSFPTDYPSWWYPGRTSIVVYEPGD